MSYTPPDEAVPAGQGEAIAAEVPAWAQDYVADTKHDVLMRSLQSYLALNGLILFAAWCYLTLHLTSDTLLLGVLAATALLALAFALMKTHPRASAAALLVVSAAAGLVMPPLLHSPQYLGLVILPVIMAGALFTPAASLACGLLASLAAMRLGGQAFAWPLFAIPALAGVVGREDGQGSAPRSTEADRGPAEGGIGTAPTGDASPDSTTQREGDPHGDRPLFRAWCKPLPSPASRRTRNPAAKDEFQAPAAPALADPHRQAPRLPPANRLTALTSCGWRARGRP